MSDRAQSETAVRTCTSDAAIGAGKYVGRKGAAGVAEQIISQMPPHEVYIEPFLGTGAVMLKKRPARSSIGVEIDAAVAAWFDRSAVPASTIVAGDGIPWLKNQTWLGCELVYCDPPYLLSTRKHRTYYEYELSDLQHIELLRVLKGLPCMVILSGYWSDLYATKLRGWRTISFTTGTRGGGRATEWLWMNFPEPFELHDSRFVGRNYRERERIKRKKTRWVNRLRNMSRLDRAAILDAIAEVRSSATSTHSADQTLPCTSARPAHQDS